MKLLLKRKWKGVNTTLSVLYIDGSIHGYVLEDIDRNVSKKCTEKIKSVTAIPVGTYEVKNTYSNRFKRLLPILLNVPCFEGIRIHPGNAHQNTDGCLLPGITYRKADGDYTVQSSRSAFDPLHKRIVAALNLGEKVTITIEQHYTE